jgi:hypothetical protein
MDGLPRGYRPRGGRPVAERAVKGKKQRFEMYLANAKLLADDRSKFYDGGFSAGDMEERAFAVDLFDDISTDLRLDAGIDIAVKRGHPSGRDWNVFL